MKYEIYTTIEPGKKRPQFRWRQRGDNGRIVSNGTESYHSPIAMVQTMHRYIVDGSSSKCRALNNALHEIGLDVTGRVYKSKRAREKALDLLIDDANRLDLYT